MHEPDDSSQVQPVYGTHRFRQLSVPKQMDGASARPQASQEIREDIGTEHAFTD